MFVVEALLCVWRISSSRVVDLVCNETCCFVEYTRHCPLSITRYSTRLLLPDEIVISTFRWRWSKWIRCLCGIRTLANWTFANRTVANRQMPTSHLPTGHLPTIEKWDICQPQKIFNIELKIKYTIIRLLLYSHNSTRFYILAGLYQTLNSKNWTSSNYENYYTKCRYRLIAVMSLQIEGCL